MPGGFTKVLRIQTPFPLLELQVQVSTGLQVASGFAADKLQGLNELDDSAD
jgi:hypothetical protein